MKLYYKKGACSLVVRIILNEMNLPFMEEEVDLKTKLYQKNKDFKAINPKGLVPTLELDNGTILTENAIILQYLADTFEQKQLLPDLHHFERYRVLEWLNFVATELHKSFGPVFNPNIPESIKTEIQKPLLKSKFSYVNQHLQNHQFLHHNQFTLPDAYLYVMVRWAIGLKIDLMDLTHLIQYAKQLENRDSIQKSLAQEGLARYL